MIKIFSGLFWFPLFVQPLYLLKIWEVLYFIEKNIRKNLENVILHHIFDTQSTDKVGSKTKDI